MAERVTVQVDAIGNFSNLIGEVGKFRSQLQSLKLPDKLTAKLEKGFDNVESKVTHFQSLLNKGITTKGDFSKLISSARSAETAIDGLKNDIKSIGDKDIQIAVANSADVQKAEEALKKVLNMEKQLSSFGTSKGTGSFGEKEVANMQKLANTSEGLRKRFKDVTDAIKTGNIDQASTAIERLIAHAEKYQAIAQNNNKSTAKWDSTIAWAHDAQSQIDGLVNKANQAKNAFDQMQTNKFSQMKSSVDGIANGFTNVASSAKQAINATTEMANRTNQINEQVGHLRTQANYFFGLQNMGRLIARGIREAAESVRDLDKAMTETAVVTDFSVSDMWNMLPEYTKLANKLGATTQGAYETMTLYFQQGLDKQATFEIGEETMKMARIAGLDYAQTTNMMTAALRGFNMELNQTSAKRVNDVYSELAAITASDTRELGLAMERTASIAHSANMDFGNTTAFLAQMIETTREAPENLGTAMKTIIARFQELKQNPYEISEVEGEEVDFNRVDKALKSIGVDLMDNRDKFRDLDDVFMDISSKWDGLSQTQQRYIATIAAGARQQSRFLAMVQNYDRLKELTTAAANSEGAATVQFNKTLESYEAKVNKLGNAWQAFTMSLANNKAVKGGVDLLQKIITFGNKIIETFGKAGKAIGGDFGKGIAEMISAFGLGAIGFKGLKFGANTGLGMLARMTKTSNADKMFAGGFGRDRNSGMIASSITNPIVSAVDRVTAAIQKQPLKNQDYQNARLRSDLLNTKRNELYGLMGRTKPVGTGEVNAQNQLTGRPGKSKREILPFTAREVQKNIADLTKEEQKALLKTTPSLQKALQKNYSEAYKRLDLSKDANAAVQSFLKTNGKNLSLDEVYNPAKLAEQIGGPTGDEIIKQIDDRIRTKPLSPALQERWEKLAEKQVQKGNIESGQEKQWIQQQRRISEGKNIGKEWQNIPMQVSKAELAVQKFSVATGSAGQAVMGLGMAISMAGFPALGGALSTVGSGIMGIGMAAEGASVAVGALGNAFKTIGVTSIASAFTNPILLAIAGLSAAVATAGILYKKHQDNIKQIKKDAKKVEKDYEEGITETTQNINKLMDSKDTYAQLRFGVDANNNNVSLGTAEYEDYLQIINEIAKMHPEMVKGYNAQGQAILNTNNAVEEAIDAEKRRKDQITSDFISNDSLDKLIAGREQTKRWQVSQATATESHRVGRHKSHLGATSKLKEDAQAVVDTIKKLEGGDQLLSNFANQFGVSIDDFTNLTDKGVQAIQEHGANMLSQTQEEFKDADDKVTKEALSTLKNSIAQVGKDTQGIEEVTEPIYKALSTYASQQGLFDNIPEEFKAAAEKGVKEVAKLGTGQDGKTITGAEMKQRVQEVAQSVENLNGHSKEYEAALKTMDAAQDKFASDLNEEAYGQAITTNIGQLMRWRDEALNIYENTGDESQRIIAESLQNQIEAYDSFTRGSTASLAEGFNEQAAVLEKAAGAADSFQKKTEGINDYYTGADNMKAIVDDIKDGVDDVGKGSRTFWAGAEELLGDNFVKNNNFKAVNDRLETIKGMFYDAGGEALKAQDSADKFMSYLQSHQGDKILGDLSSRFKEVGEVLNVTDGSFDFEKARGLSAEQFTDLANSLGMSDQLLASMLNKAAQFYNIDFSNADVLRKNLAVGEGSIGTDVVDKTSGNNVLYTKRSAFEAEAEAEGYSPPELEKLEGQLKDKGVKLLSDATELVTQKGMSELTTAVGDMGIKSGQEFIKNFSELGYDKGEIQSLYDNLLASDNVSQALKDKLSLGDETFGEAYNDMINERDLEDKSAEDATADNTSQIASNTSAILAAVGGLNVNEYDKNKQGTLGADGQKYYKGTGFDALKEVYGDKGRDTMAQKFAAGIDDKTGKAFTSEEAYQTHYNKLLQMQKNYDNQAAQLEIAAQNASDNATAQRFTRQAEYLRTAADGLDNYMKKGEEAHQQYLKENQEEEQSDNQKANNKTNNDKKEIDSEQQYKQLQADLNELRSQEPINLNTLFGLDGQNGLNDSALQFSSLISNLSLSQEQVTALGNALQTLTPGELQNLNNVQLGGLLSQLNLTETQLQTLNTLNPNIQVTSTADTSEADAAVENVEAETAQPKVLQVIAEATGNVKQVAQQAADQAKQQTPSTTTVQNNITSQSTVTNPEEPKQKMDEVIPKDYKATVNTSITMNSTVSSGNTQKQLQQAADKDSKGVKTKVQTGGTQVMRVTADTSAAQAKITALTNKFNKTYTLKYKASGPSSIKVPISANFTGSWQKTVTINKSGATGINNYLAHRIVPSFGSAAKGRGGRLGPNNKGGLTLTGEKGFEIAWLPSENRSMILGAEGPQMLKLPNDAVVWNHEQSKDILKKKQTITAGSMVGGSGSWGSSSSSSNTSSSVTKTVTKTANHVKKNSDKVAKAATDAAKSVGYVSVWWENIARKTEKSQRIMDSNSKAFEKYIKEMRATLQKTGESLASGGGGGDDYIKSITKYIGYNQAQVNKATAELRQLDKGTAAQQKALKTKTTKDNVKANKAAYSSGAASAVQISYSYKTGKKKKKSKTKNEIVNTSGYIVEQDGTYVINQAALNKVKNVERRKALKDALEKEINDRLSKKYTAEDNIQKAKEALEKMGEELYKTFFAWENELTRIWNLTKKIAATENNISRVKEYQDTLNKQLTTGFVKSNNTKYLNQTIDTFILGLTESTDKIRTQIDLVNEQKQALQKILSIEDERATLTSITNKLNQREALDETADQAAGTLNTARSNLSKAQSKKASIQGKINSLKLKKKKTKKQSGKNSIQAQINAQQKLLVQANKEITKYQQQVSNATTAYNTAVANAVANLSDTEKLGYEEYKKTLEDTIETQVAAQKYLSTTQNADGTVKVEFDTTSFEKDRFEGLLNESRAKAIQDYVKQIVDTTSELGDAYKNANSSINELYDELSQLQDDWAGYASELWDISEEGIKKETENFKQLSSSISDALKRLLEDVKRKLDERRQQEDNAQTERDIAQKQQRLAALRADTSGGNQVEIAKLEQEIAKSQQDYQRDLENQLLDKLQQQADLAAEQRERQIEIQETISEGVNNAALVNLWMSDPAAYRNEIYEAYKAANDYDKKPDALRDQIDLKFEELMVGLTTNQDKQEAVVDAIDSVQSIIEQIAKSLMLMTTNISNAKANGLSATEAKDLLGVSYEELRNPGNYNVDDFAATNISYADARQAFKAEELKDNNTYNQEATKELTDAAQAKLDTSWKNYYYSKQDTIDSFNQAKAEAEELGIDTSTYDVEAKIANQKQAEEDAKKKAEADAAAKKKAAADAAAKKKADTLKAYKQLLYNRGNKTKTKDKNWGKIGKDAYAAQVNRGKTLGYSEYKVASDLANTAALSWQDVLNAAKKAGRSGKTVKNWNKKASSSSAFYKAFVKVYGKWNKFATGGLANYTGPAWLDGTPAKPELVLNATDTKNFLALKDVLSKAITSTNSVQSSYGGDTNFEVNINVDHLNSDYDVDKVADRVRKIIVKDAGYRNVTQVRNFR